VNKTVKERVAKGQCPHCGAEAAPYYMCGKCRFTEKLRRTLRRGERAGAVTWEPDGRSKRWVLKSGDAWDRAGWGAEPKEGDSRLAPRLRGMRIDVERTLIEVMRFIGRPCTEQEIVEAWGKLRANRTDPLPIDLGRIIAADSKRARKMARRAAHVDHRQAKEG
jgi:ribosomal protein S27AE